MSTLLRRLFSEELSRIRLFQPGSVLENEVVEAFLMQLIPSFARPCDLLCCEGDLSHEIVFITEGKVLLEMHDGWQNVVVGCVSSGEMFGDAEYVSKALCLATYRAAQPCHLLALSYAVLKATLKAHDISRRRFTQRAKKRHADLVRLLKEKSRGPRWSMPSMLQRLAPTSNQTQSPNSSIAFKTTRAPSRRGLLSSRYQFQSQQQSLVVFQPMPCLFVPQHQQHLHQMRQKQSSQSSVSLTKRTSSRYNFPREIGARSDSGVVEPEEELFTRRKRSAGLSSHMSSFFLGNRMLPPPCSTIPKDEDNPAKNVKVWMDGSIVPLETMMRSFAEDPVLLVTLRALYGIDESDITNLKINKQQQKALIKQREQQETKKIFGIVMAAPPPTAVSHHPLNGAATSWWFGKSAAATVGEGVEEASNIVRPASSSPNNPRHTAIPPSTLRPLPPHLRYDPWSSPSASPMKPSLSPSKPIKPALVRRDSSQNIGGTATKYSLLRPHSSLDMRAMFALDQETHLEDLRRIRNVARNTIAEEDRLDNALQHASNNASSGGRTLGQRQTSVNKRNALLQRQKSSARGGILCEDASLNDAWQQDQLKQRARHELQVFSTTNLKNRLLFHPEGIYKTCWDVLTGLLILYSCLVIPVQTAFAQDEKKDYEYFVDAIFLLDIVWTFQTIVPVSEAAIQPKLAFDEENYDGLGLITAATFFEALQKTQQQLLSPLNTHHHEISATGEGDDQKAHTPLSTARSSGPDGGSNRNNNNSNSNNNNGKKDGVAVSSSVLHNEAYFVSRRLIAVNYVRSVWFYIDLLSSLPFDLIIGSLTPGDGYTNRSSGSNSQLDDDHTSSGQQNVALVRLIRVFRLLRLLKIAKAGRLRSFVERLVEYVSVPPTLVSLMILLFQVFFIGHLLACLWWGITVTYTTSLHDNKTGNWAEVVGVFNSAIAADTNTVVASRYVAALYYIFTTITTVGYGDMHPFYTFERIWCLFLALAGAIVFGYILASVSGLLSSIATRGQLAQDLVQLSDDLRATKCPPELEKEILQQYRRKLKNYDTEHLSQVLQETLPARVALPILDTLHAKHTRYVAFFPYIPSASVAMYLFQKLQPRLVDAQELICCEGSVCDDLRFLVAGQAVVFRRQSPAEKQVQLLQGRPRHLDLRMLSHLVQRARVRLVLEEESVAIIRLRERKRQRLPKFQQKEHLSLPSLPSMTSSTHRERRQSTPLTVPGSLIEQHSAQSSMSDQVMQRSVHWRFSAPSMMPMVTVEDVDISEPNDDKRLTGVGVGQVESDGDASPRPPSHVISPRTRQQRASIYSPRALNASSNPDVVDFIDPHDRMFSSHQQASQENSERPTVSNNASSDQLFVTTDSSPSTGFPVDSSQGNGHQGSTAISRLRKVVQYLSYGARSMITEFFDAQSVNGHQALTPQQRLANRTMANASFYGTTSLQNDEDERERQLWCSVTPDWTVHDFEDVGLVRLCEAVPGHFAGHTAFFTALRRHQQQIAALKAVKKQQEQQWALQRQTKERAELQRTDSDKSRQAHSLRAGFYSTSQRPRIMVNIADHSSIQNSEDEHDQGISSKHAAGVPPLRLQQPGSKKTTVADVHDNGSVSTQSSSNDSADEDDSSSSSSSSSEDNDNGFDKKLTKSSKGNSSRSKKSQGHHSQKKAKVHTVETNVDLSDVFDPTSFEAWQQLSSFAAKLHPRHTFSMLATQPCVLYGLDRTVLSKLLRKETALAMQLQTALAQAAIHQAAELGRNQLHDLCRGFHKETLIYFRFLHQKRRFLALCEQGEDDDDAADRNLAGETYLRRDGELVPRMIEDLVDSLSDITPKLCLGKPAFHHSQSLLAMQITTASNLSFDKDNNNEPKKSTVVPVCYTTQMTEAVFTRELARRCTLMAQRHQECHEDYLRWLLEDDFSGASSHQLQRRKKKQQQQRLTQQSSRKQQTKTLRDWWRIFLMRAVVSPGKEGLHNHRKLSSRAVTSRVDYDDVFYEVRRQLSTRRRSYSTSELLVSHAETAPAASSHEGESAEEIMLTASEEHLFNDDNHQVVSGSTEHAHRPETPWLLQNGRVHSRASSSSASSRAAIFQLHRQGTASSQSNHVIASNVVDDDAGDGQEYGHMPAEEEKKAMESDAKNDSGREEVAKDDGMGVVQLRGRSYSFPSQDIAIWLEDHMRSAII